MRLRRGGAVATAALLAITLAGSAAAAAAEPVRIDLHVVFDVEETFTATGFCPEGTAESFGFGAAGVGRAITFHLFKTLTCSDGSGTLTIRVEASFVAGTSGTIGGWSVVGGTGTWAGTRGGGLIVGTGFDGGIDDVYTGHLTN